MIEKRVQCAGCEVSFDKTFADGRILIEVEAGGSGRSYEILYCPSCAKKVWVMGGIEPTVRDFVKKVLGPSGSAHWSKVHRNVVKLDFGGYPKNNAVQCGLCGVSEGDPFLNFKALLERLDAKPCLPPPPTEKEPDCRSCGHSIASHSWKKGPCCYGDMDPDSMGCSCVEFKPAGDQVV